MAAAFGSWDIWDNDWATSTTTSNAAYVRYLYTKGSHTYSSPPSSPPKKTGPLAWLDDRVDEIAEMGRDLMEAA